jgi:hypothetical protein
MAVAFDTKFEKGGASQASPFSFVSNAGTVAGSIGANSNRVLIVVVQFATSVPSVTAVTWNSVSMSLIANTTITQPGAGTKTTRLYGLIAPATGAQTIAVTWTGGAETIVVGGVSLYDADQSTGWQNGTTATGTDTAATITVTSANGNLVVGARSDQNATTATIANGTQDWDERNFDGNYGGVHRASTTGSTVMGWTLGTSVDWGMAGVDVIAAAGGGSASASVSPSISASASATPSASVSSSASPSVAGILLIERPVFDYYD